MRATFRTLAVALPLLGAAASAPAQVTTFTSRAAFAAAAGPLTLDTFDRPFTLVPTGGASYAFTGGTVTFDANHGDMTFGGGDLFADLHPAGDPEPPRFLRFSFAAPVTAFGADFSAFDAPSYVLRALVGGGTFDVAQGFFGVVSTVPFTTVELRDPTARTFFVVDNASVSASSVVPEPATVWLVLGGLGVGAAAARRRARRRAAAWAAGALTLGACADRVAAPAGPAAALDAPPAAAAAEACDPGNGAITLPAGFCAAVVADSVGPARHMAFSPEGDLYVAMDGTTGPGGVLALRDTDGDGRADERRYFGAVRANGILVARHALYVAYRDQIVRYRLAPGELVPAAAAEVVVSGLPFAGDHFRKNIQTDGRSAPYVNIGSASNSCQVANRQLRSPGVDPCPELDVRAGIWRFDLNATGQTPAGGTRYAMGYRNMEALRYDAGRRTLFGVQHGRDMLDNNWPELFTTQQGADLPSEEFVRIGQGTDNGWPYCFHDWQKGLKVLAPEYGGDGTVVGPRCASANAPLLTYPGHWAPNDLLFYYGAQFPARYRGGAFVAFHGGFDRAPLPNEGYTVAFVPFGADAPSGPSETFADGFTGGGAPLPANAAHRPMGLAEGADGSLYVSDDRGGRIWRIVYRGE